MPADVTAEIIEFVRHVVGAMGLSLAVTAEELPDGTRVSLDGDGAEILVRRKGEVLDALQQIVNVRFRRALPEGRRIVVDCLDFRKGKDAELREMTRFLIDKAKTTGVSQEIGPLNPYARRIVHLTVAEDPTVASESVGDAFLKTVIISVRKL